MGLLATLGLKPTAAMAALLRPAPMVPSRAAAPTSRAAVAPAHVGSQWEVEPDSLETTEDTPWGRFHHPSHASNFTGASLRRTLDALRPAAVAHETLKRRLAALDDCEVRRKPGPQTISEVQRMVQEMATDTTAVQADLATTSKDLLMSLKRQFHEAKGALERGRRRYHDAEEDLQTATDLAAARGLEKQADDWDKKVDIVVETVNTGIELCGADEKDAAKKVATAVVKLIGELSKSGLRDQAEQLRELAEQREMKSAVRHAREAEADIQAAIDGVRAIKDEIEQVLAHQEEFFESAERMFDRDAAGRLDLHALHQAWKLADEVASTAQATLVALEAPVVEVEGFQRWIRTDGEQVPLHASWASNALHMAQTLRAWQEHAAHARTRGETLRMHWKGLHQAGRDALQALSGPQRASVR